MTSKQASLFGINQVCQVCRHFNKMNDRFYCEYFQAFLSEETLSIECDFQLEECTK
jgi:hypothetical protein